ncbi:hypothetical protein EJM73_09235 [Clostridium botulinum]|uniref:hypothetical protein n=1 Tax=Clostridium botulinum TaxID=1491 RepID=UPI001375F704|nr:hypothetical protein [Clostridium botulinum]NCI19809.1 hypothetical protein [Clostridium botulinum]NCI35847.1 hypothetical protein [Clostridium botulinum]NCI71704.1 hypothetical protein [Clostridium botulinum]NDI38896.1 hypothetical protein [Clostridium botulinum]
MINCTIINNDTGEVLNENFKVETLEDKQRKLKGIEKNKLKNEFKNKQQNYLGNFVFFIFKYMDKLTELLNNNDLIKFIYLGTYVKKNGALMLDNNITYVNKKKLQELLNIGNKAFYKFYNNIIDCNLLKEIDEHIYINNNVFYRGSEKEYKKLTDKKLKDFTRLYIKTTRDLYKNIGTRSYNKLAIAYKLLPHVNWKYNILCNNINEINKDRIEPLTIENVINIIRYNKNQMSRFKKDFYGIKYKEKQLFKTIQNDENYNNSFTIVNPLLYYRGNDIKELEYLIMLFELEPINNK